MAYGTIEYDKEGNPKCEICDKHYKRVLTHVRQKHGINERNYKLQFGFDLVKGICSKESSEKTRVKTILNYDKCIIKNLIINGTKTRKSNGDPGRKKDKVSAQTRLMLKERLRQPYMVESMKINGERLGKSGLGNKKRWENNNNLNKK